MRVIVDLTSLSRRMIHARLVIPVAAGPLTLLYPKWLPGDHGPTGPINDLAGIFVKAGGKDIGWVRDPGNMYAFRVVVPPDVSEIEVTLDYLIPATVEGIPEGASASSKLAILNWSHVLLVPAPARGDLVSIDASLTVPDGWSMATALPVASSKGGRYEFKTATMTTLIDSPVLAGAYFRTIVLDERPGRRVVIDIAADAAADLAMPDSLAAALKQLVREADAVFGSRPFGDYHFLLALSDQVSRFSLEHHDSSDNRCRERSLVDDEYRRPSGLRPDDFQSSVDSSLLFVYEGLSQYLGWVLTARSGQLTTTESLDGLAIAAAEEEARGGRRWRDFEDTGTSAQILYESPTAWGSWRRSTDFYDEGTLVWLDVDVTMRRLSKGKRSLDDFCRRFFGGGTPHEVKTYEFGDVVSALNAVVPNDWSGFLAKRLHARGPHAPLEGIEAAGYTLGYSATASPLFQAVASVDDVVDLRYSLGIVLEADGSITDVVPESAAWSAGLAPGMKVIAVNERKYSKEVLGDAIRAGKDSRVKLAVLVESAEYFRTVTVEVAGGLKFPVLERGAGDDLLGAILAPKAKTP
jgi:predicted metalloprotease with PDZ domain